MTEDRSAPGQGGDRAWAEAAEVFAEAADLSPEERAEFLERRCAGNAQLRERVEALLAADDSDTSMLDRPDPTSWAEMIEDVAAEGDPVGPYVLLREIGRGGMGRVYLAERADGQFEQQVAIKLVKRGMDTDAILERFLRERQILARLQHPNIAQLTDGGVTDDGRPYFVMEYVEGQRITDHCDDHRLSIDARLALFEDVCRAVEHAHRNLVIHRDIKPSNILVNTSGHPKLLDFGVGKIMSGEGGTDVAPQTVAGGLVATPEYAAPEQLQGGAATTSTDVFGLGAVLFELLVGCRAFSADSSLVGRLRGGSASTPTPSLDSAFRRDTATADEDTARLRSESAHRRSTTEARLLREFKGDLNVIVRKALRPEPEMRYASVEALREDVRRYRAHLPIKARQGDRRYRLARFARRHRMGMATATAFLALLFGGVAAVSMQNVRIQSQADEIAAERDRAQREASAARQVGSFLVDMFSLSEEAAERGDSVTARQLLDATRTRVDEELVGDPDAQARVLVSLSEAYENLYSLEQARATAERAVEIRRNLGSDPLLLAESLVLWGTTLHRVRRYEEADQAIEEAIAIYERSGEGLSAAHIGAVVNHAFVSHAQGDPRTARERVSSIALQFDSTQNYSDEQLVAWIGVLRTAGRWEEVAAIQHRRLPGVRDEFGPTSRATLDALSALVETSLRLQDSMAVDTLSRELLEGYSELEPGGLSYARALRQVAAGYERVGRFREAGEAYREAIRIFGQSFGPESPETLVVRENYAGMLFIAGRAAEAAQEYEDVLPLISAQRPPPITLPVSQTRYAHSLHQAGRLDEAEGAFRLGLELMLERFPSDYLLTATAREYFARYLLDVDMPVEAASHLLEAIPVYTNQFGEAGRRTELLRLDLTRALAEQGRRGDADSLVRAVLKRQAEQEAFDETLIACARRVGQLLNTPPVPSLQRLCQVEAPGVRVHN